MRLKLELGSDKDDVVKPKEDVRKIKKNLRKLARKRRIRDYIRVLRYKRKYDKEHWLVDPTFKELAPELDEPCKLFAFCLSYFTVLEGTNQPKETRRMNELLEERKITHKELVWFMCKVMKFHYKRVHWFVVVNEEQYALPVCAVVEKYLTITMSTVYRIHTGDQFDIMRDYYPKGIGWKVMNWDGSKLVMTYRRDRHIYGGPDIMVYDEKYWDQHQPLAYHILKKMRMLNDGRINESVGKD